MVVLEGWLVGDGEGSAPGDGSPSIPGSSLLSVACHCLFGAFFPFLPQFPHLLHSSFSAQLPEWVWDERRVLRGFDASREALGGDQGHQFPPQAVPRVSEVPPGRAEASWVPAHAEQA